VYKPTSSISEKYELGEQIGQAGQFGYALVAKDLVTNEKRAVKVVSKCRFKRTADRRAHFESLRAEIAVLQGMHHHNIIKFYEVFEDRQNIKIVMELAAGGELFDRIQEKGNYSEKEASDILRQMFKGVKYLHEHKVAHCDLKPDNFVFKEKDSDVIKIIDFGMAKFVKKRHHFHTLCGTPYYVAPEVINEEYAESCDIWSMGVVMFVMLFGYPPFYADQEEFGRGTDLEIFRQIQKGFNNVTKPGYGAHFPADSPCSDSVKDLIHKCLNLDPVARITAAEALKHPWLTGEKASSHPIAENVLANMCKFNGTCKFKDAVLDLMVNTLEQCEIKALRETFEEVDSNGDGEITAAELKEALATEHLSVDTKSLESLLAMADVDGDGVLSWEELLHVAVQKRLVAKEERLFQLFTRLDLNHDGVIDASELKVVLGDHSDEHARELIEEVDTNGDGTIDYREFLHLWYDKKFVPMTKRSSSSK